MEENKIGRPRPRSHKDDLPTTMDDALSALQRRQAEETGRVEDQSPLKYDKDFETHPTPAHPDQRAVIARIEVNMQSLELLTRDLFSFINQADLVLKQKSDTRDPQAVENIQLYFIRLHDLLSRICHDVRGSDYKDEPGAKAVLVQDPLKTQEVAPALRSQVESTCQTVLQNLDLLSGLVGGRFADLIKSTEALAKYLQGYFQKKV